MVRVLKMFRGVTVRRTVATADVAATQAQTQMDPGRAGFQAFFTTLRRARGDGFEIRRVLTFHCGLPGEKIRFVQ